MLVGRSRLKPAMCTNYGTKEHQVNKNRMASCWDVWMLDPGLVKDSARWAGDCMIASDGTKVQARLKDSNFAGIGCSFTPVSIILHGSRDEASRIELELKLTADPNNVPPVRGHPSHHKCPAQT
jgi:hypothetical protein